MLYACREVDSITHYETVKRERILNDKRLFMNKYYFELLKNNTDYSTDTTLHNIDNTIATGFSQNDTNIPRATPSLSSLQTASKDAKLTQLLETQHLHNGNSKLAFHKEAFFLPNSHICASDRPNTHNSTYADEITILRQHTYIKSTHTPMPSQDPHLNQVIQLPSQLRQVHSSLLIMQNITL